MRRYARWSAHQTIDEPGLPADLRSDPAGRVGDVWERHGQHQEPQQLALSEQPSTPQFDGGEQHHRDENSSQSDHDVIAEIKQRDVIGPAVWWKRIKTFDLGFPTLVSEKAERARHLDR